MFPSCSNPPIVNTKQNHSSLIGVTVGSAIAAICFIFIVGASVTFLLYKGKQSLPENNLDASSSAVYSHLFQGIDLTLKSSMYTHAHIHVTHMTHITQTHTSYPVYTHNI